MKSKTSTPATTASSRLGTILKGLDRIGDKFKDAFDAGAEEKRVSTGFLSLDALTGGGIIEGRVVEIFGNESSGKSTLSLQMMNEAVALGQIGLYMDFEATFMPSYAEQITGMKVAHLEDAQQVLKQVRDVKDQKVMLWTQPFCLEDGIDLTFELSELFGEQLRFIVFDSLAAMTPRVVLEKGADEKTIGEQARLLSPFYSKATKILHKRRTSLIVLNQMRAKIGGFVGFGGENEESAGGKATKFYATQRFKMSVGERHDWKSFLPDRSHAAYIKVRKNKTSPDRLGTTRLVLWPGRGFSAEIELLELLAQHGVLANAGPGTYKMGETVFTRKGLLEALTNPQVEEGEDKAGKIKAVRAKLREKLDAVCPDRRYLLDITASTD